MIWIVSNNVSNHPMNSVWIALWIGCSDLSNDPMNSVWITLWVVSDDWIVSNHVSNRLMNSVWITLKSVWCLRQQRSRSPLLFFFCNWRLAAANLSSLSFQCSTSLFSLSFTCTHAQHPIVSPLSLSLRGYLSSLFFLKLKMSLAKVFQKRDEAAHPSSLSLLHARTHINTCSSLLSQRLSLLSFLFFLKWRWAAAKVFQKRDEACFKNGDEIRFQKRHEMRFQKRHEIRFTNRD